MAWYSGGGTKSGVGGAVSGQMGGSVLMGPAGGVAGAVNGFQGKGDDVLNNYGFGNRKANEAQKKAQQANEDWYSEQQPGLDKAQGYGQAYYDQIKGQADSYMQDAATQGADARKVYTGTIQPRLQGIMEDAQRESNSAMTLQQAGDPNNAVQTAYRNQYNQEGANAMKQGQADAGVLAGLGAQATAQQIGGAGPMTGGQMAAMQGANMSQAGQAAFNAQKRMNDLRQQGMDVGREESGKQYDRGQSAKDRYRGSVADYAGASSDEYNRQHAENQERFDMGSGVAGLGYGTQMDDYNRRQAALGNKYGQQMANYQGQAQQSSAEQAGKLGFIGSMANAGAKVAGKE